MCAQTIAALAIIPARGGSKGIPRKNVRPLAGKPLIAHTIEQARETVRLEGCNLDGQRGDRRRFGAVPSQSELAFC